VLPEELPVTDNNVTPTRMAHSSFIDLEPRGGHRNGTLPEFFGPSPRICQRMVVTDAAEGNDRGITGHRAADDLQNNRSLINPLEPIHTLRKFDTGIPDDPALAYLSGECADRSRHNESAYERAAPQRNIEPFRVRVISERRKSVGLRVP
jgi:hypothetical protein